ncbi:MAG: 3-phosphoglycerate dehydrogenase [Sulfuricurvum sp. PC08-66]|nr:MAG: 3-phosphoglycerate dehydrogenase [Sulfuricurvum sp. PC08-66]
MSKHKIVVCDHIHESGLEILRNDPEIEMVMAADVDKVKLLDVIADADIAITRSSTDVDTKFITAGKKLKAIVRAGVGVDNVDIDGCSKEGVIVMNVPTANTIAAVELTMTHILSCMRMFPYSHDHLKNQRIWKREKWYGYELKGKKLGIIGFGNIGSRVGKRALAFEMDVIAYDPYILPSKATDVGVAYTKNFEDILACDIITIHTPKNSETVNMIDAPEIAKMKDGVVLINCARGDLYNEKALYDGLKSGKIRFAGMDVFSKEPATDHPLLDLDNICVSPHLGANTFESQYKIAVQAAENAIAAAKGIGYPNALNLPIDESTIPAFVKPYLELGQKLGFMLAQASKSPIESIKIVAEGEIAQFLKSLATFVTVGALKESIGDNINYINAEFVALERGIKIEVEERSNNSGYKNRIGVKLTTQKETLSVYGTIFDEERQRIVNFNAFELDIEPKGHMILFKNSDVPGVIGQVGTIMAKHAVNIADFRLGRNDKGQALAIIIVDEAVKSQTLQELAALEACLSVAYVNL